MSKHKDHQHIKQGQQGEGRLYKSYNKETKEQESKSDISRVDQQEGSMNNGEEEGNFRSKEGQDGDTVNL